MTNAEYVEHFKVLVGVVETYGGVYGREPGLVATELVTQGMKPQDIDTTDRMDVKKIEEVCRKCYLSCMLLRGANNSRHYQLKVDLSNDMMKGTNNFPKTMVKAMCILTNYVPPPRLQRACDSDAGKGLALIQGKGGALCGPKKDSANKEVECWHCDRPHYKNKCPGRQFVQQRAHSILRRRRIQPCPEAGERGAGHPVSSPHVHQHVHTLHQHSLCSSPHKREQASPWTCGPQQRRFV